MLLKVFNLIIDLIFPPNEVEKILRTVSVENIYSNCSKNTSDSGSDMYSIFLYKDVFIKDAIYELKNNKNKHAINLFSELLSLEIMNFLDENIVTADYRIPITFIPQHKSTYLNKGYNQAKELASKISKSNPEIFELSELLLKKRKTKPQHELNNKKERLKNLKNTFEFNKSSDAGIKNKLVFLIDDVYTTGATLNEGRQKLLASGASKVVCFTIAH